MSNAPTLRRLVELGRGDFNSEIIELRSYSSILRVDRDELRSFAKSLSPDDLITFIKSIAMVEHEVGGLGSVTNLQWLLPLTPDSERKLFEWILRNTNSYRYYSHDAHSVEEFDLMCQRIAARKADRIKMEQTRQIQDKARVSADATNNLYNAVRRGDLKAVQALLAKGADATVCGPDGTSLITVAMSKGFDEIATELRNACRDRAAP